MRLASGFTVGPGRRLDQLGVEAPTSSGASLGRAAAVGNAAGPRGGSIAGAWLGLPVELRLQLFSALEKPGRQRLVPVQSWTRSGSADTPRPPGAAIPPGRRPLGSRRRVDASRALVQAGGLRSRLGGPGTRELPANAGRIGRRPRRPRGLGRPDGRIFVDSGTRGPASPGSSPRRRSLFARAGDTGARRPLRLFAFGGAPSAILPPGLDRNRVESPALPAAVQPGERFEAYRAELSPCGFPLVLYAERLRAWNPASEKPDWIRLEGLEVAWSAWSPPNLTGPLSFYAGVARVRSHEPRFDSIRGYGGCSSGRRCR